MLISTRNYFGAIAVIIRTISVVYNFIPSGAQYVNVVVVQQYSGRNPPVQGGHIVANISLNISVRSRWGEMGGTRGTFDV